MSFVKMIRLRNTDPRAKEMHRYSIVPSAGGKALAELDEEIEAVRLASLINLGFNRGVEAGRREHARELRALLNEGKEE